MPDVLKGNYKTPNQVTVDNPEEDTVEERFEKEALKHLGGSVCFVSKKQVHWGDDDNE